MSKRESNKPPDLGEAMGAGKGTWQTVPFDSSVISALNSGKWQTDGVTPGTLTGRLDPKPHGFRSDVLYGARTIEPRHTFNHPYPAPEPPLIKLDTPEAMSAFLRGMFASIDLSVLRAMLRDLRGAPTPAAEAEAALRHRLRELGIDLPDHDHGVNLTGAV